jgi:hypothetical protein
LKGREYGEFTKTFSSAFGQFVISKLCDWKNAWGILPLQGYKHERGTGVRYLQVGGRYEIA